MSCVLRRQRGPQGDPRQQAFTTGHRRVLMGSMLKALSTLAKIAPDDEGFSDIAAGVDDHVRRHGHHAAEEIHPRLRELASDEDLSRLGNRVEIAAEAAPTRPHPASPSTPPWNKVVDPVLGTTDKLRDVLDRPHPPTPMI